MTDLLPCPFCGSAAVDRREIDGFPMIYCNGDECFGPQTTAKNFDDAILQWNRRVPGLPQEVPGVDVIARIIDPESMAKYEKDFAVARQPTISQITVFPRVKEAREKAKAIMAAYSVSRPVSGGEND